MVKKDAPKQASADRQNSSEEGLGNFLQDTQEELSKIVWPSRQQLLSESVAVILMVTLVATVIYLVDNFFTWASGKVF